MVKEQVSSLDKETFDCWRREEKMDWIYVNGKRMFSSSFFGTLRKVYPKLLGITADNHKDDEVDRYIDSLQDGVESERIFTFVRSFS